MHNCILCRSTRWLSCDSKVVSNLFPTLSIGSYTEVCVTKRWLLGVFNSCHSFVDSRCPWTMCSDFAWIQLSLTLWWTPRWTEKPQRRRSAFFKHFHSNFSHTCSCETGNWQSSLIKSRHTDVEISFGPSYWNSHFAWLTPQILQRHAVIIST